MKILNKIITRIKTRRLVSNIDIYRIDNNIYFIED